MSGLPSAEDSVVVRAVVLSIACGLCVGVFVAEVVQAVIDGRRKPERIRYEGEILKRPPPLDLSGEDLTWWAGGSAPAAPLQRIVRQGPTRPLPWNENE